MIGDEQYNRVIEMRYIDEKGSAFQAVMRNPLYCLRCGNRDGEMFGVFDSYILKREIYYCRSCLIFGRMCERKQLSFIQLRGLDSLSFTFKSYIPKLTEAQLRCMSEVEEHLGKGEKELDVIAVTGAGKTEIMLSVALKYLQKKKTVAFVCPRSDVVRELYERIETYFPEHLIVSWHTQNKAKRLGHIYVMTMHQLIHYEQFFDLIIIDEADAYPFVNKQEDVMLKRLLRRSLASDGIQIYMTATPKNRHGKAIYLMTKFNNRLLPLPEFLHIPYLRKRIKYHISFSQLSEFDIHQWLIFVPSIQIGKELYAYFRKKILVRNVQFVWSQDKERIDKIEQFRNKQIDILITTSILERGVTFSEISVAIFFPEHELMTKEMIIQICGRVDRGIKESEYRLCVYYDHFTTKVFSVSNRIEEMNKKREAIL